MVPPSPTPTSLCLREDKSAYPLPQGERNGNANAMICSSPLVGEEGARAAGVGRRGGGSLLPLAKRMRREPTEAERKLWAILRGKRLAGYKFKRQQPIGPYIADFVNFARRVIVEADGSQHAENAADAIRDDWFKAQGFIVLRIWNSDILANSDVAATAIWQALQTEQPPLPARSGQ